MLILADANIPFAEEAFGQFGDVRLLPGREMTAKDVKDADALLVRSVTKVGPALLDGAKLQFVGTATIGTDHLDIPYLEQRGVPWSSAAGCNARSVVEWVIAALVEYALAYRVELPGTTLGIVGHGNIGSRLAKTARAMGFKVLVNDPPLAETGQLDEHVSLDEVLTQSDFVTCHVPYIRDGAHPTHHLIGTEELRMMKNGAAFLNSSRGVVLDNAAAMPFALSESVVFLLDVFEGEPRPDRELVKNTLLSTPHIAGYSFEGKVNGTAMIAAVLGKALGTESTWQPPLDPPANNRIEITAKRTMLALREAIGASYDIQADNNALREGLFLETEEEWGAHFDRRRKEYPVRREFANYRVVVEDRETEKLLLGAGFTANS